MKIRNILIISILMLILFISPASAAWYDTSFQYRTDTQIVNGTRPYQISLNISNAIGVNTATQIYCNGHCNSNFSDIRFVLDNTTPLPYWIENITTGLVWVNVTNNGTVNMYYGNSAATSLSNGNTTFIQWRGIETANYLNSLSVSTSNMFEYRANMRVMADGHDLHIGLTNVLLETGDEAEFLFYDAGSANSRYLKTSNNGVSTSLSETPKLTAGTYYNLRAVFNLTNFKGYINEDEILSNGISTNLPNENLGLFMREITGNIEQNYALVRNYASVEPSWVTWGTENVVMCSLELLSPINGLTTTSPVTLIWRQAPENNPYEYQVATDGQFINIVSSGIISNPTTANISTSLSLNSGTYYWHVKNSTGTYLPAFNFTIASPPPIPGRFNISVFDEVNHSLKILNFTAQIQNGSTFLIKTTTTGWVNFSPSEVTSGMYLVYITPGTNYLNYYPRMELAISPADVAMYLPNSTSATINIVSFSLLDVSGKYPYTTSTITVSRGGYVMESSNFSSDGTHAVYLIQGLMYQVTIRNGNNIFSTNYLPSGSGTSAITINDMSVNMTLVYPFRYNITYNSSQVTLNWNDVKGILNSLNFTVNKGIPEVNQCQLVTSVPSGQSPCSIDNLAQYHVIFSANTTEGFVNQSFFIDYSTGYIKPSTGVNPIDGSPMGIGFNMSIGTFTMPQNILNWVSLLIVILLAGSFGARYANIGAIVVGIVLIILESVGWFVPISPSITNNTVIIGITGALTFFAFLYFLSHKDRYG